ncbi:hypothetical protein E3N88_11940 [Mikania micrantha]|uniref:Uncharacterized protein n=1 Tax=Mikania micrantha TaxID=192012 RepID=A0A5N6P5W6_9ASTR|nr:hypothetical protein E3N88_11940 [Mikania micrantha]
MPRIPKNNRVLPRTSWSRSVCDREFLRTIEWNNVKISSFEANIGVVFRLLGAEIVSLEQTGLFLSFLVHFHGAKGAYMGKEGLDIDDGAEVVANFGCVDIFLKTLFIATTRCLLPFVSSCIWVFEDVPFRFLVASVWVFLNAVLITFECVVKP